LGKGAFEGVPAGSREFHAISDQQLLLVSWNLLPLLPRLSQPPPPLLLLLLLLLLLY
jgi:hypothetical protein